MPRLSLYKPERGNDYAFLDKSISEMFTIGGTDVFVHKYLGPKDVSSVAATQAQVLEETQDIIDNIRQTSEKLGTTLDTTEGYFQTLNTILKEITDGQSQQGQDPMLRGAREVEALFRNAGSAVNVEIAQIFNRPSVEKAIREFSEKIKDVNDPAELNRLTDNLSNMLIAEGVSAAHLHRS